MNNQIQSLIQSFAKENKISKAKLEALANSIIGTMPKQGRPMMDKTISLQNQIVEYIRQGKTSCNEIIKEGNLDKVTLANNIKALEKRGLIKRIGVINTGKKGRKPVQYSVTC